MLAWQAASGRQRKTGNSAVREGEQQEGMRSRLSWSSVWVAAKERRRRSGLDREGGREGGREEFVWDGWMMGLASAELDYLFAHEPSTARPLIFFPIHTLIQTLTGVQSKQK
jgi:hypothetical protein